MSAVITLIDDLKRRNVFKVLTAYAVASFIMLQLCDILFPATGLADAVIGYILGLLLLGLPLIVIFAWMFEVTPEGLKRSKKVSSMDSITHFTGQRMNLIIIALLTIALAFFAFEYINETDDPVETATLPAPPEVHPEPVAKPVDTRPSIAVLPFVNMSSDQENEYFSDGLSEEVLNLLAQIKGLRVAGRTSSFFYKGKSENLAVIGKSLNVDHILEGSVRKSGDKVGITAQLISAEDGFHLWSRTFDREINDIFAVQDEIAGEVTRAMRLTLLTDNVIITDRSTTNPETYDLYLRAKAALYTRELDSGRLAIQLFQQAIALDPEYAPALIDYAVAEMVSVNKVTILARFPRNS